MDLPPPVQEAGSQAGPERPPERDAGPERPPERKTGPERPPERETGPDRPDERETSARAGELEWRLSQLEAGLRHIDRRLDRLEESIAQTVADETQAVSRDLRRTVSELGRRLVLELPQVLARHRDEIVAELRPPEPPPDTGPVADPPAGEDDAEAEAEVGSQAPGPEPVDEPATPAKRRRRVHVLRQRDA